MMRWVMVLFAWSAMTATADAKTVRVFTVGPRFDLSWVDSREHFHAKLDGMVAPLQRLGRDRDLAVLPEDIGLLAAFSGSRGAPARSASDLTSAIAALTGAYATPIATYAARYPDLASRAVPTRLLALGLTDTFGRVAVESFAELADRYDLWLEAGIDMARDWRIVCRDQATFTPPPGATRCDAQDPGLVAALGDPDEPARDYAYEATTPDPVNMALLFDPDGHLVSKQVKAYLTPVELPGQLDLVPGDPHDLTAVDTPVGKLGFVTSKDAWMPDVTARLDDAGVELLVQPEFFVGDTVRTTGMWAPDTLKAAGYSDLLRHPAFQALALPELTGDVYEFSADAQSHIAVRPRPGGPSGALVGQDDAPGFAAVQPWIVPDPVGEPIADRRAALGAAGEAAVGSGTQPEGTLTQDVELAGTPPRVPVRRRRDRPLAPSRADQRHVALASQGRSVWAAWDEHGRIRVARSRDRGRHFGRPRTRGRGTHPALSAARQGAVWLTFQRADGKVVAAEGGGHPQTLAPEGRHQERPSIAAFPNGDAYAVWLDDRAGEVGVYGAPVGDIPVRLDQGPPDPLAATLDNAWAPSVAYQDQKLLVTWTDFRAYKWDVYARISSNHGGTFAPQTRVNDSPDAAEALDDTPRAGFELGDPFVAWTDFRKRDTPAVHPLYDVDGALVGGANRRLDGDGGAQRDAFAPATAQLRHGRLAVAWQAHRGPTADVMVRRVGARVRRADDAGKRAVNSWRPAITAVGANRVLVAWEDDRDGPSNIFGRVLVLPSAASP
ncbi:MAG: hypothetical protein QOI80_1032 [Solirubrobacteraceae bacterium]|nr:hypothetical protein [Solirubrobacteraceae bacterium]